MNPEFPQEFIKCVLVCILTASFSIILNGSSAGYFKGGRGLRQGDPLSPLLFVLSMEYLSRFLHQKSKTYGFGFHPNCMQLKVMHLMFAEDLILFCKVKKKSVENLMQAFHKFSQCSGREANPTKSQVVMGGYGERRRQQILETTASQKEASPLDT